MRWTAVTTSTDTCTLKTHRRGGLLQQHALRARMAVCVQALGRESRLPSIQTGKGPGKGDDEVRSCRASRGHSAGPWLALCALPRSLRRLWRVNGDSTSGSTRRCFAVTTVAHPDNTRYDSGKVACGLDRSLVHTPSTWNLQRSRHALAAVAAARCSLDGRGYLASPSAP